MTGKIRVMLCPFLQQKFDVHVYNFQLISRLPSKNNCSKTLVFTKLLFFVNCRRAETHQVTIHREPAMQTFSHESTGDMLATNHMSHFCESLLISNDNTGDSHIGSFLVSNRNPRPHMPCDAQQCYKVCLMQKRTFLRCLRD